MVEGPAMPFGLEKETLRRGQEAGLEDMKMLRFSLGRRSLQRGQTET